MSDSTGGQQGYQPAWHPDPLGRHQLRYHDGTRWTEHVSDQGTAGIDPPVAAPQPATQAQPPQGAAPMYGAPTGRSIIEGHDPIQASGAVAAWQGGGHLFNEPILVISQKAQIFEVNQEYAIRGANGAPLGWIRQVGQSSAKKAMRVLTNFDQYMTHHLDILDAGHNLMLRVTRPAKVMKSRVIVQNNQLQEIGQIIQKNMVGKIRFELVANGQVVGSINAENWRAWNFRIDDSTGTEVARITKTWEGLVKTMFTTADNYVVHIHRPLDEPLRSLVVASASSVDVALKQDSRGFS
jgi:hypothetical protein